MAKIGAAGLCVVLACACGGGESPGVYETKAGLAMAALADRYGEPAGSFDFTWWQTANALEATIDYTRLTGDQTYLPLVTNSYDKVIAGQSIDTSGDFLNDLYDDESWWALTLIKAYDLTGDARYLESAKAVFADVAASWDDTCGGGVWWDRARTYKNAITNELFLVTAARLYQRTDDPAYRTWAEDAWAWFDASGMINASNGVNDGLVLETCANNGQTEWTYNQGVILGGLVAMFEITEDRAFLTRADAIADHAMATLVNADGVLVEPCEPDCGRDGFQFKGIFMRNLGVLHGATQDSGVATFITRQADAIIANAMNERGQIGGLWAGPFDEPESIRQGSGLDALNAAIPLE